MWLGAACLVLALSPGEGFDHSAFDALLRRHVVAGVVDYGAFGASSGFGGYLDSLWRADPSRLPRDEQLAFWLNAYNAYTIALILEHHERASIRNIPDPWKEPLARVGGSRYTLDHIEHEIIRAAFSEPRIHFALVCAARSCPPLRSEAYTGAKLEAQLTDQAKAFLLASPGKNHFDASARALHLSPIVCEWYRKDFGGTDAAIEAYLSRFYPEGPEKDLLARGEAGLVPTAYDWRLNGAGVP